MVDNKLYYLQPITWFFEIYIAIKTTPNNKQQQQDKPNLFSFENI